MIEVVLLTKFQENVFCCVYSFLFKSIVFKVNVEKYSSCYCLFRTVVLIETIQCIYSIDILL